MGIGIDTIIDGHNLIFQCGLEGRTRNSGTIGRAREAFVVWLAGRLTERQRVQTTVVFDAKTLPANVPEAVSRFRGLTIMYAVEYDEADSLIEELIKKNSSPKKLTVVSSDHRLHRAARRRKATAIDSDVWYDQIESSQGHRDSDAHDDSEDPGSDRAIPEGLEGIDWNREFGLDEE